MEKERIIAKVCEISERVENKVREVSKRVEKLAEELREPTYVGFDEIPQSRIACINIRLSANQIQPEVIKKCKAYGFKLQAFTEEVFGFGCKWEVVHFELNTAEVIRAELKI